jgi:outer membrane protein TolC
MKMMVLVGMTLAIRVSAQEKKTLSLNEAIDLGIKNSKQLKTSQAKIDEATAVLKVAEQKKLPDATASASYLRLSSANFDLKTKNNNNNGGTPNETPKVSQAMYGIVNASLPIYTGGRIRYGIESASFLEKASRLDAGQDKDEVIQNTIEAFANLFKANTAVRLMKENLLQAQQRAKDLANLEKNGLLARNDLLKAELQSSNMELSVLDAENNLQLANINMNLLLGLPINTDLVLDTTGIEKKYDARILDDYIQLALVNRKDRSAMDLRKKAGESGIRMIKGEKYPSLNLTGGYIAADVPKVFSVTNAVNIGVGFSYNISSLWKNKAKVQEAQAQWKQLETAEAIMDDNIRLQVSKNYLGLLSNRKKIDVYAKALEQATENYRIVKNKFNNSLATTTELLDADLAQLQASLSFTLARADAFVAYHKLLESAGLLSSELKK